MLRFAYFLHFSGLLLQVMLTGIIQGGGVQCDCRDCRGLQVINVSAFEKHAGSSNRHPSDFIFIENGKCLRDILKAGWNAGEKKLNVLEVIKAAIGEIISSNNRKRKPCFKCGSRDGRLVSCARGGCSNTFHQGSTPSCFACFKLLMFLGAVRLTLLNFFSCKLSGVFAAAHIPHYSKQRFSHGFCCHPSFASKIVDCCSILMIHGHEFLLCSRLCWHLG
jgi:hypothetical protein